MNLERMNWEMFYNKKVPYVPKIKFQGILIYSEIFLYFKSAIDQNSHGDEQFLMHNFLYVAVCLREIEPLHSTAHSTDLSPGSAIHSWENYFYWIRVSYLFNIPKSYIRSLIGSSKLTTKSAIKA